MLNIICIAAIGNRRREPGRDGKILSDYKQDGNNVATDGIGNLAR